VLRQCIPQFSREFWPGVPSNLNENAVFNPASPVEQSLAPVRHFLHGLFKCLDLLGRDIRRRHADVHRKAEQAREKSLGSANHSLILFIKHRRGRCLPPQAVMRVVVLDLNVLIATNLVVCRSITDCHKNRSTAVLHRRQPFVVSRLTQGEPTVSIEPQMDPPASLDFTGYSW
jgi:hypothetical protein